MTMRKRRARRLLAALPRMSPMRRMKLLARMPDRAIRAIAEEWWWGAHGAQHVPKSDWLVWLLMAGRGHGKTRAGAEWVWSLARADPQARIALVGGNLGEVVRVMVKGPSGLIACAGTGETPVWIPSERTLRFPSGAEAHAYSAERPESLRGPEHDFAWCDELAKWRRADETWDNLMLGLRRGPMPRAVVTTTPRAVPLLRRIRALEGLAETHGTSAGNPHVAALFLSAMERRYGGTRFGRQELGGELIEDVEGSLWPLALIEGSRALPPFSLPSREGSGVGVSEASRAVDPSESACRRYPPPSPPFQGGGFYTRVVVGVDPPASAAGTCGISVCALGADGLLYVLADPSEAGLSPEGWARSVAGAVAAWGADRVVAEANNGGDMVMSVLKGAAPHLPVRLVHASRGKVARAEPVAAAFERGGAKLAGRFPALEDELTGMVTGGGYEGPGTSPDRADAMVWAMTELMQPRREPRVRVL